MPYVLTPSSSGGGYVYTLKPVKQEGGNADMAEEAKVAWKLKTLRKIIVSGEVDGEGLFDGSGDVDIYATVDRITNSELEAMLV